MFWVVPKMGSQVHDFHKLHYRLSPSRDTDLCLCWYQVEFTHLSNATALWTVSKNVVWRPGRRWKKAICV